MFRPRIALAAMFADGWMALINSKPNALSRSPSSRPDAVVADGDNGAVDGQAVAKLMQFVRLAEHRESVDAPVLHVRVGIDESDQLVGFEVAEDVEDDSTMTAAAEDHASLPKDSCRRLARGSVGGRHDPSSPCVTGPPVGTWQGGDATPARSPTPLSVVAQKG